MTEGIVVSRTPLTVSREIVTRHGGRLWAVSGKNGSTFLVALPLATRPAPDAVTNPAAVSTD